NHLAVIETAYLGKQKAVRLIEAGRAALTMVWNAGRFSNLIEAPQDLSFRTVAPARTDDGENDVELGTIALKLKDSEGFNVPCDAKEDQFTLEPTSGLGRDLSRIKFTPLSWQCLLNYGGVVKIYDQHGRANPPY